MRYAWLLLAPLALGQTGCDTSFPNEEMDVAGGGNTRPLAMVCEPAEAAPGASVTVRLYYYEPDPDRHDVSWQVALDYDLGQYEADEVERDIVPPDVVIPPTWDTHGYCSQTVQLTVPDDALLRATSLPERIHDELILALARPLLGKASDATVTKTEIDVFLDDVADTPDWEQNVDPETATAVRWLSDFFACQIRFRATIDGAVRVDVTKTLTVRYSSRIRTLNVNENPGVDRPRIAAVPYPDVLHEDISDYADEIVTWELTALDATASPAEIPLHRDWTYYLYTAVSLQIYLSPFAMDQQIEDLRMHWYHYDLTNPAAEHPLFVQDDGDEAEMWDLDREVRLRPPSTAGHAYRVFVCARDERLEWINYAFAPGADLEAAEFVFVDP